MSTARPDVPLLEDAPAPRAGSSSTPHRILVVGATGYIGRAVVQELSRRGHHVVALARRQAGVGGTEAADHTTATLAPAEVRFGDVTEPASLDRDGFAGERFDVVVSCLASRTGDPDDAARIDRDTHLELLRQAQQRGVTHFVQLSAICLQRPRLGFQHAKLAFEAALIASGMRYSIVRPTAFFKSLSGQVRAVAGGRPFFAFGDGQSTACKPISARDLACFIADTLDDPSRHNAVLPIGGPGPALTPLDQAAMLTRLTGQEVAVRRVPAALLDVIVAVLTVGGLVVPALRKKAQLARIGRYYARESMLVWDDAQGAYSAERTPSYGRDTLEQHYRTLLANGAADHELGDHAVFSA